MGYACPVCEDPQADVGHLANHLAFTAMLGEKAHETWLDEHAPGWGEMGEADLARRVVDQVEETEFPQVFDDTVGGLDESGGEPVAGPTSDPDPPWERSGALFDDEQGDSHSHDHDRDHDHHDHEHYDRYHDHDLDPGPAGSVDPMSAPDAGMDAETQAILEEAREMTREMMSAEVDDGNAEEGKANEVKENERDASADVDNRDGRDSVDDSETDRDANTDPGSSE